ncbi:hypothetical protein OG763_38435 [Streptomyces sp. NBC_01230]|uniref:hypothetical protein n=1 Tax=Streptomyces sp. NBC_01230 TaxID=2903784 RepID=UPI002E125CAD|nr:hypothetical protein OG763_38435 [Streptomyces sp. NBC_01230]
MSKAAENLGSAIQNMEQAFREEFVREQGDVKDKLRALVEKYNDREAGREATMDALVKAGEYEGTYAYDSALTDNDIDASGDLGSLLGELAALLSE